MKKITAVKLLSGVVAAGIAFYEYVRMDVYLGEVSRYLRDDGKNRDRRFDEIETRIVDNEIRTMNLGVEVFGKGELKRKKGEGLDGTKISDKLDEGISR